jgi:hypothetical protein
MDISHVILSSPLQLVQAWPTARHRRTMCYTAGPCRDEVPLPSLARVCEGMGTPGNPRCSRHNPLLSRSSPLFPAESLLYPVMWRRMEEGAGGGGGGGIGMDPAEVYYAAEGQQAAAGSSCRVSHHKLVRRCCHPSLSCGSTRRVVIDSDNGRTRLTPRIARAPSAMTWSSGDQEPARSLQDGSHLAVRSLLSLSQKDLRFPHHASLESSSNGLIPLCVVLQDLKPKFDFVG